MGTKRPTNSSNPPTSIDEGGKDGVVVRDHEGEEGGGVGRHAAHLAELQEADETGSGEHQAEQDAGDYDSDLHSAGSEQEMKCDEGTRCFEEMVSLFADSG